jgi:hypothetical protein
VHQATGGFEIDLLVLVFSVVHDGRVGQRSPNRREGFVADLIVDDFVAVEQV